MNVKDEDDHARLKAILQRRIRWLRKFGNDGFVLGVEPLYKYFLSPSTFLEDYPNSADRTKFLDDLEEIRQRYADTKRLLRQDVQSAVKAIDDSPSKWAESLELDDEDELDNRSNTTKRSFRPR